MNGGKFLIMGGFCGAMLIGKFWEPLKYFFFPNTFQEIGNIKIELLRFNHGYSISVEQLLSLDVKELSLNSEENINSENSCRGRNFIFWGNGLITPEPLEKETAEFIREVIREEIKVEINVDEHLYSKWKNDPVVLKPSLKQEGRFFIVRKPLLIETNKEFLDNQEFNSTIITTGKNSNVTISNTSVTVSIVIIGILLFFPVSIVMKNEVNNTLESVFKIDFDSIFIKAGKAIFSSLKSLFSGK
eukprot:TRINITY_DN297_c2_g2_i1.p1 TRINITY_DN297_c2_g2~~TRINITY_DN297_c2_g2_i1.p1  ORF type:complete len:244 (+),score=39.13 TRINITY_DN297_c2_g2_i1:66-797(+)